MIFEKNEPMQLNSLSHINSHVSYLLTCDSKAKDDSEGLAVNNIIVYYDDDGELVIENGYDLKKRTSLAKEIRKMAKESLKNITDRCIQNNLRMELSYLTGLSDYHVNTDEGFQEMVNYIVDYIEKYEDECIRNNEKTFLYVFHLHQEQCPHLHRFYKK